MATTESITLNIKNIIYTNNVLQSHTPKKKYIMVGRSHVIYIFYGCTLKSFAYITYINKRKRYVRKTPKLTQTIPIRKLFILGNKCCTSHNITNTYCNESYTQTHKISKTTMLQSLMQCNKTATI